MFSADTMAALTGGGKFDNRSGQPIISAANPHSSVAALFIGAPAGKFRPKVAFF